MDKESDLSKNVNTNSLNSFPIPCKKLDLNEI